MTSLGHLEVTSSFVNRSFITARSRRSMARFVPRILRGSSTRPRPKSSSLLVLIQTPTRGAWLLTSGGTTWRHTLFSPPPSMPPIRLTRREGNRAMDSSKSLVSIPEHGECRPTPELADTTSFAMSSGLRKCKEGSSRPATSQPTGSNSTSGSKRTTTSPRSINSISSSRPTYPLFRWT